MCCYDCICEKPDAYEDKICQLSTCGTFDEWNCSFYNTNWKDFVKYILKVNKHKGDDFEFSTLEIKDYGGEDYRIHSEFYSKKDLYVKDFLKLLQKQNFWERDREFFEEIKDEKVEHIEFYGDQEIGLCLYADGIIDEIEITKKDSDKFELLEMLYFRNDKTKLKDILLNLK